MRWRTANNNRKKRERRERWVRPLVDEINRRFAKELAQLRVMPDDAIDTSDIPEIVDWSNAERGKFARARETETT